VLGSAKHVQLVGHNIAGFDIPFLWKRAMVLGVKPSFNFPRNPKPWGELICDTLTLWDSQQRAGGSMDRLCKLMGIPGKGDFSGADVWPAIERGEFDRVAAYCRDDVERTRAMHKRMTFAEAGATVPGARLTQGQRVEVRV
jgi:predicted PolB exonuclease-like 3'-5' exonuclease